MNVTKLVNSRDRERERERSGEREREALNLDAWKKLI